jgi:hypothetical protein
MSVNFEIKGMLARLLATEDLIVEHKKVETACFNVHTRVLTLPMWEKASNTVYDMLVAHEVSHALYTPDEDWSEQVKVPQQFVNIVEDARVEKLMKRRYMGLAKTFYGAYKELHEQDFFAIGDEDVSTYNLADRVNLFYKVGNFLPLSFNQEEFEIVDMIGAAETFGDALIAAEVLYKYCTKEQKEQQNIPQLGDHQQSSTQSNGNTEEQKEDQKELIPDEDGEKTSEDNTPKMGESDSEAKQNNDNFFDPQGGKKAGPDVKTMSSLEESIKNLANNSQLGETVYLEVPELNLDTVIISNDEIHNQQCASHWANFTDSDFTEIDKMYVEFKRSAQKEVNYLVKEFECRKSADSYARATVSKTGVLDCTKLHTYKYNEDLFKKVTTLANGKNHGLVFVLDWSGSMSGVMMDTIKQLYNLIWFCRKVSIPFEVYAFTTNYGPVIKYDENNNPYPPVEHMVKKNNHFMVDYYFNMMNLFTSKVRNSDLDKQMKNIMRVVNYFSHSTYTSYSIPPRMQLSGTPLNESLIALHQILPKFQKENKLQKVQCVILTDGEAGPLNYYREVRRNEEDMPRIGTAYVNDRCFLRDRKTGNVYSFKEIHNNHYVRFTDLMLRNLRDKFPTVNFIGMRILDTYSATSFIRQYTGQGADFVNAIARWKKEKSFSISSSGYHKYFGISSNVLNKTSEFVVEDDASKSKIKSAFVKSLNTKKMNKKILGEFISLIA